MGGDKVMIAGLYGLCHDPEIRSMGEGEHYHDAPLWVLNDWSHSLAARYYKPARIFNVHNDLIQCITNLGVDFEEHIGKPYDMAIANGIEVWLSEPCARFPDARVFPFEAVKKRLNVGDWFFSSSLTYMIGLAIYEGYSDIGLRCVSMANDDEYYWQALGVLYAIRKAAELGGYVDYPMRVWLEERFTEDEFRWLVNGAGDAPEEARNALYRFERPYHTLNRYEQEEAAQKALAWKKKTHV
jgi:hypothetical protein